MALRLKQPSTELTQFAQIYPVLIVPSIYLICPKSGVALEVLAGVQSADSLLDKISKVLKAREELATQCPTVSPAGEVVSTPLTSEMDTAGDGMASTEENSVETCTEFSVSNGEATSMEDKVKRAQRLIEAVRQGKAEAQKAEEQRKEIERREAMKNLQKIRREMEDREIKNFVEERNKEREEEKRYKAQLQEQIRQDRLERQQKFAAHREPVKADEQKRRREALEKQEETQRLRAQNASSANILFRMPDGSTVTHLFEAETPFIEVRQYIADAKRLSGSFNLALNFPRKVFKPDCDQKTLRDLSLAPSAVLLVIARTQPGRGAAGGAGGGAVTAWRNIWDIIVLPFTLAMGFFTSFFAALFPSTTPPAAVASRPQQEASMPNTPPGVASATPHDAPGASRARVPGTGSSLRQRKPYERSGNIHRLNTDNDDSDENNTWNGNSTQQM
ncbi:UBX domain-containing protein 4-like isoform X2 [Varroa destructor]|nr:UBX domain-containing protein 4-like isoform X2 [Varroa destructor]